MAFVSIFVPNFMVQALVRAEPALRKCALALIDGNPPLCKVVAVNGEAARAGIEIGMTKMHAAQFAGVEIRPRSRAQEKIAHDVLLDLGWSVSPRIEDTAQDAIVLDLSGLGQFIRRGSGNRRTSRTAFRECGLLANVAIASNVDTALIAARGFAGITVIPPGEEAERLGDLPVGVLAPSAETAKHWSAGACARARTLPALPVLELSETAGAGGRSPARAGARQGDRARLRSRSRAMLSRKRWSWKIASRNSIRFRFFWAGCSISFARGWRRVR